MGVVEVNGVNYSREWLRGHSLREAHRILKKHPKKDVEEAFNKANGITPEVEKEEPKSKSKAKKKD